MSSRRLPHVYEDDVLCLHLAGHWTADMSLATPTVRCAAEWLLHQRDLAVNRRDLVWWREH